MDGLSDDDWDDWRVVQAAWAAGTFSAAAEALGIGQATVSRRVARAEEALGHTLFDRHRSGLRPTAAARALRPHLVAMAEAARGARRAVEGLEVEPEGRVRVAAPPAMCVDWLPRLAVWLQDRYPRVRLAAVAGVEAADLSRREADLALRMMPSDDDELLAWRVATLRGGVYAAPSLVEQLPEPCAVADVPLVAWSDRFAHIPVARALAAWSSRPPSFTANDHLVIRQAVCAGLGASVLGELEAEALGLVEVPAPTPEVSGVPLFVVVHRALRGVPRVAAVIEAVEALVGTLKAGRAG